MAIKQRNIHDDWRLSGVFASTAAYLTSRNKSAAAEGDIYYDTTLNQLRNYDGSSWSPAGQNGNSAGSLDDAAQIGAKITNTDQIEIERTYSSDALFVLDQNSTGTSARCLNLENASNNGSSITVDFASTNGFDIDGTSSSWYVKYTGDALLNSLLFNDSKSLKFGTGSDVTINWDASNLLIEALVDDTGQIRIGSTNAIDLSVYGSTNTNIALFDVSAALLDLDGWDLRLKDADILEFGDASGGDVNITWDGSNLLVEAATDNVGQIRIGSTNAMDMAYYGSDNSKILLFDVSLALLKATDWDMRFSDNDLLQFGSTVGGDISFKWDTSNFLIEAKTQDTGQIRIGSTNAMDFVIYDNAATGTITNDVSTSIVDMNGWDIRLQDDDYLLFGDSATPGAATDATIRWDATNSVLEIIGSTTFEGATVTFDNDVTISGTLTMSGAFAPGSLELGDTETLSFGDDTDYTISTAGSTAALIITAVNANDAVHIGDGSVATDFLIDNITVAGADVWWDQSADTANGVWYFGKDNDGVDVFFYGATASANIQWDYSADQLVVSGGANISLNDNVELLLGTGSSNAGVFKIDSDGTSLFIREIAANGAGVEFGVNNKGLDVKFFGETASVFMEWDQSADALVFDNADIEMGDGDIIVLGDGTDFSISATGTTVTTTLAAGSAWNISDTDNSASKVTFGVTGGTHGMDVTFNSISASEEMAFDAAAKTFTLDNIDIILGDADSVEFGDGTDLKISATTTTTTMLLAAASDLKISDTDDSASKVTFGVTGGTHGLDVQFNTITSGEDIIFDAAAKTLIFDNVDITLEDNDLIKFGDAGADGSIVSDGTNIDFTINAALTLGDGGSTNYANIAADGEITLAGTAMVTKNHQLPIATGGGTSTVSVITGAPSIDFNADAETAYATFQTPNDWDGASDLTIVMMVKNEIAETDGDDIEFVCTVNGISDGGAHTDVGQSVTLALNLTGGDEGQNVVNKCTGTIDWNHGTYDIAAGDTVIIKAVVSLGAGTEPTGPLHIIDWWIEYTANKLGTAT